MDPKDQEFGDEFENEEGNDSEKTNATTEEEGVVEKEEEKEIPPADDKAENKYRPSEGEDEEPKAKAADTVPLKKYLDLKAKLKEATEKESPALINQTLEEFANDSGLTVEVVSNLAKLITQQATAEATRIADERVKPIVLEKINKANLEAFEADFNKSIVSKYPELAGKIEVFRKVAFSKDFLHLKNLEEIKNEFFPEVQTKQKEVKSGSVEGGSAGGSKEVETIDFAKLKENPEQYEKVMKDPVARAKYYEWQDNPSD